MKYLKWIFLVILGLVICSIVSIWWSLKNEGGPPTFPINLGGFSTIGSSSIDPKTLLKDIQSGKEPILTKIQTDTPDDPPFIMQIAWSQSDYLNIAKAYHKAVWHDDPSDWYLSKAEFYTGCENTSGFEYAELHYFQEVDVDGEERYSVRSIVIMPENGYVAWGGDTTYPIPKGGWESIDLSSISSISADKALTMAEQQGGSDIRKKVKNACNITVFMWPFGFESNDWRVIYSDNLVSIIDNNEFSIPTK